MCPFVVGPWSFSLRVWVGLSGPGVPFGYIRPIYLFLLAHDFNFPMTRGFLPWAFSN